jgi:hypothetical protein
MNPNPGKKIPSQNPPPAWPRPVPPQPEEGPTFDFSQMHLASTPSATQGRQHVMQYPEDPGLAEATRELFTVMALLASLGPEAPWDWRSWLQARKIALLVRILRG